MKWIGWLALALVATSGCSSEEPEPAAPKLVTVTYEVVGDLQSADVTMQTPTGTSQQTVAVPIKNQSGGDGLSFKMREGAFAYIAAQNGDSDSYGPIQCRISVDGRVVSENSSTGQFSIATCKAAA